MVFPWYWHSLCPLAKKIYEVVKIILHREGTNTAVGLVGDTRLEVIERYYSFWNHHGTSGELFWLKDEAKPFVAYFWSDEKRIKSSIKSVTLLEAMECMGEEFKGVKGGFMPFVNDIVEIKLSELTPETFLNHTARYDYYDMGVIKAENKTDYSDDK
jgi:hypothetical protein